MQMKLIRTELIFWDGKERVLICNKKSNSFAHISNRQTKR